MANNGVKIGEMNKRIKFNQPIMGRHPSTNEQTTEWVTSSELWAKIEHVQPGSDEGEIAGAKTSEATVLFSMYFINAVQPTWKILHGVKEYEILSILPQDDFIFMIIEAKLYDD